MDDANALYFSISRHVLYRQWYTVEIFSYKSRRADLVGEER